MEKEVQNSKDKEMKKVVIVMTYYDRPFQLRQTLDSIDSFYVPNLEIVIVDDGSPYNDVNPVVTAGNKHVIRIEPNEKNWHSPVVPQNIGVQKALDLGAEIIILQNAECRWMGNIADYARLNLTQENYISFACYSLDEKNTFDPELMNNIHFIIQRNNEGAMSDGSLSWYNHKTKRAVGYDFCAAITRENILKLNGYDERYSDGIAYSDDDLVMRVKRLGLKIEIPEPMWLNLGFAFDFRTPFVLHQWHYSGVSQYDKTELVHKNKALYEGLGSDGSGNYRAVHQVTPDLI